MKRMVCVFAHPDDEAMGPGGTIAKFAKESEVFLVCATSGNGTENPDPEKTGKIRKKELLKSAKILGIKQVACLDFDDGELSNNNYHELARRIEEKVRQYQPDTLMTFETNGVTGHLDHVAVSLTTSFVFKKVDFVRTLLYYCESKEMVEYLAKDYFIFIPAGYSEKEVDECIDISSELDQKIEAIKAHKSQQKDVDKTLNLFKQTNKTTEYFLKLEKSHSD